MKLTFENYDTEYSIDTEREDFTGEELIEMFSRMLVVAGYSPDVIQNQDGSRYEVEIIMEDSDAD